MMGLFLGLLGCDQSNRLDELSLPSGPNDEEIQQSVTNLVEAYRTAMVQEDIIDSKGCSRPKQQRRLSHPYERRLSQRQL